MTPAKLARRVGRFLRNATILGSALSLCFPLQLFAVDYTWTGAGSGTLWSDTANWTPTGNPSIVGDTALFDGAAPVAAIDLDGDTFVLRSLHFGATADAFTLDNGALELDGGAGSGVFVNAGTINDQTIAALLRTAGDVELRNDSPAALLLLDGGLRGADYLANTVTLSGAGGGRIGQITQGYGSSTTSLVVADAGSWTFDQAGTLAGDVQSALATIVVGHDRAFGTAALSLSGGVLTSDSSTPRNLANALRIGGPTTFGQTTGGTGALTFTGDVELGGAVQTLTIHNGRTTFWGDISGAGAGLVKAGTGTLVLAGDNSFTEGVVVQQGTLLLGSDTAIGTGLLTLNNAVTLASRDDAAVTLANDLVIAGSVTFGQALGGTGALVLDGDVDLGNSNRTLSILHDVTINGVISSTSVGSALSKSGPGTLVLTNTQNYTGETRVTGGILRLGGATGDVLADTSRLSVNGGTRFELAGLSETIGSLNNNGVVDLGDGTLTFGGGTANSTVNGQFTGTGTVVKAGGGMLTLQGTSTFTGSLVLSGGITIATSLQNIGEAGTLGAGDATSAATNAASLVLDGGTLRYTGTAVVTDRSFTLTENGGTILSDGRGTIVLDGPAAAYTGTGPRTLTLGGTTTGNTFATSAGSSSVGIVLADGDGGPTSLVKSGEGIWRISGANSYTGSTSILGGTLIVATMANGGSNSSIGAASTAAENLVIDGGILRHVDATVAQTNRLFSVGTGGATFDSSASSSTNVLRFNGTGQMGFVGGGSRLITLTGTNTSANNIMAAQLADNGFEQTSLWKKGTGVWTLLRSGATTGNTYTGTTTIERGTLRLNFNATTSPQDDLISTASSLVMRGGILTAVSRSAAFNTQGFNSLTLAAGASAINAVATSGGGVTYFFGAIDRQAGATINFDFAVDSGGFTITDNTGTTGILGGYATVQGANWATVVGGNIEALATYVDVPLGGAIVDGPDGNVRITGGVSGNITLGTPTVTINTLLQDYTTAATIDTAGGTLRFGSLGGVLVAAGRENLTIGTAADSGVVTAGGVADAPGELFLNVVDAADILTINSAVADNGLGAVTLTKSGAGIVVLNGTNTYGGGTFFNQGTIRLGSNAALSAGPVVVNGLGVLTSVGTAPRLIGNDFTLQGDLQLGDSSNTGPQYFLGNFDLAGDRRTINSPNGYMAIFGEISNGSLVKAGGNVLALLNPFNSYTGGTYLTSGTLEIRAPSSLGTGPLYFSGGTLGSTLGYGGPIFAPVLVSGTMGLGRGSAIGEGIHLAGDVDLLNGVRSISANGSNQHRISGVIANGGITKIGTADLILSNRNTYTLGTTVNRGWLTPLLPGSLGQDVLGNNVTVTPTSSNSITVLRMPSPEHLGANQVLSLNANLATVPAALALGAGFAAGTGNSIFFNIAGTGLDNVRLNNTSTNLAAILLDGIRFDEDIIAKTNAAAPDTKVWFGATFYGGRFVGTTLSPGAGATYRFGGGGGTLVLENADVLTGTSNLVVGSYDATARGSSGALVLPQAQSFTGSITVGNGGNLAVASNAALGDPLNDITLLGGTMEFRVSGDHGNVDTQYAERDLTVGANSTIALAPYGGLQQASVHVGGLTTTGGTRTISLSISGLSNLQFTKPSTFVGTGAAFTVSFAPTVNSFHYTTFAAPIGDSNGAATLRLAASQNSPTLVLAADNTYTGDTLVSRGVLVLAHTGAAGNPGSGVRLEPSTSQTATLDLRTDAVGTSESPVVFDFGTLTLGGTATTNARILNVDRVSGLGSGAVIAVGAIDTGTESDLIVTGERGYSLKVLNGVTIGANFTFNVRGTQLEIAGGVSDGAGTFNFTKTGTGRLVLSGTAAYNGTTSVNQGTLIAAHDTAGEVDVFGTGNLVFGSTQNSGILLSGARTLSKAVSNNATGGIQVLGGIDAGDKFFTGNIAVGRGVTLTAVNGGDVTFSGVLSGTGGVTVGSTVSGILPANGGTPPLGRGTVVLDPSTGTGNTFTGTMTINSGMLVAQAQAVSGSPLGVNNAVALNDGALMLRGLATPTADSVTSTTGALSVGGGANLRIVDLADDGFRTIFEVGGLTRTGTGAVAIIPELNTGEELLRIASPTLVNGILAPWAVKTVSETNRAGDFITVVGGDVVTATYGSTNVDDGDNDGTSIVASAGGALTGNRFAYALKLDANLDLAGNSLSIGELAAGTFGGLILNNGANVENGTLNFGSGEGIIYVDDASTSRISASITGLGVNSLTKFGAGTLILSGNNTYRGATVINRGTLRMDVVNGIGGFNNPVGFSQVTVAAAAVFDLNNFDTEIGNLTGDFGSEVLLGSARLFVGRSGGTRTFSGRFVGDENSVLVKGGTGLLILDNTRGDLPSALGELRVNQGQVRIVVTGNSNGSPYEVGNSLPAETNIVLRGGEVEFYTSGDNTSSQQVLVAGNSITVDGANGNLDTSRINSADANKLILFNNLTVGRNAFATVGANAIMPKFLGTTTLADHAYINVSSAELTLDGRVTDDGGMFTLNKVGGSVLNLNSALNDWGGGLVVTGGTVLFGARGGDPIYSPGITFNPNSLATAGTGSIVLNNNSAIRLNDVTNLAAGQSVWVIGSSDAAVSLVDVRTDRTLADYHIRSLGSGALAVGSGGAGGPLGVFSEALDMSRLGDGTWGLAASQDTVYTSEQLGVGVGDVYRFFGNTGGTFIIRERNVLTGTASLSVGRSVMTLGAAASNTGALVRLLADQNYTGNTVIHRTSVRGGHGARLDVRGMLETPRIENYGRFELNGNGRLTNDAGLQINEYFARPGSSLRLDYDVSGGGFLFPNGGVDGANASGFVNKWQDDLEMILDGSQLNIVNASALQSVEQIGGITYSGGSEVYLERRSTNGQPILLVNGGLTRVDLATLGLRINVDNELGGAAITAPGVGSGVRFLFANPLDAPQRGMVIGGAADGTIINMVAPQFVEQRQMLFVDYDPAGIRGFTSVPVTSVANAAFNNGGLNNGTEIIAHATNSVTSTPVGADVWALKTSVGIAGANPITIRSGGLIVTGSSLTISAPLVFDNGGKIEADIWTSIGTGALTLSGGITAENMTKNGVGTLVLAGSNPDLTGMLQLNGGTVQIRGNTAAGGLAVIRMHGSYLNNDGSYQMSRIEFRADTTNAASRDFAVDVVVSANMPYADIYNDRYTGSSTNQTNTINNLTIEGGGVAGTVLAFLNGNDFDFTVNGTVTLGTGFDDSPVGINVQNNSSTNRVTFAGLTAGNAGIIKSGNGILRLTNGNNDYFGRTVLNDGTIELLNATTATDLHFLGFNSLELNRGTLQMISSQTNTNFLNVNDVRVAGQVQLLFSRQSGTSPVVVHQFGGDDSVLTLANSGNLIINSTSNAVNPQWRGATDVTGNQTIFVNGPIFTLGDASSLDVVRGSGRIVKQGNGQLVFNSGKTNTFTGGLDIMYGRVKVLTAQDTFGAGPIRMSPGAILEILTPDTMGSATITSFAVNSAHQTILALGSNTGAGFTTLGQVNALLQAGAFTGAAGQGGLVAGALNAGNFNFLADQSALGNGYWFVGSILSNTTFSNVTMIPGAENVFRFGGGGLTTYLNPTTTGFDVLKNVDVGGVGSRLLIGKPHASWGNGAVVLDTQQSNSFTGGTTISRVRDSAGNFTISQLNIQGGYTLTPLGTGAVEVYGNLQFESSTGTAVSNAGSNRNVFSFHPGSRLIFDNNTAYNVAANTQGRWADAVGIDLRSSSLEIIGDLGVSVHNTEVVGSVTFSGGSELRSSRRTSGGVGYDVELNIGGTLTRVGFGTLTFIHDANLLGVNNLTGAGSNVGRIKVADTTGLIGANGMVNPFIMSRSQNQFLRYDPTNGFQLINFDTPHVDYVATTSTTLDASVSAKLVDGTAILSYDEASAATLAANLDVYALRINGTIHSSADLTATQITVRSGGLAIYSPDPQTINADVVFGTSAVPTEALIQASSDTLTINGKLTATNITKYGTGFLTVAQDQQHFTGQWNLNQGGLQILTPFGLGSGEVFLNGWTGNTGQTQTELRLNFNPLTPEELVFTSGKITVLDQNLIRAVGTSDRTTRISAVDLKTTSVLNSALAVPGVLRFQIDGARSTLRTGTMTLFDHYLLQVDATSFGPGTTVSLVPDAVDNQGLYDLDKIGDGVLQLGDNVGFTGGRRITVAEGAVRVAHANAFGAAGSDTRVFVEHGGSLEIAVAGFAPHAGGSITLHPGAIERWAADGARPSGHNLDPGAHLQIYASQTGSATYGLNGGSIMGYLPVDNDQIALINSVGANITFQLLADSFLGQPYSAGVHNQTGTANHLYYDMGKANLLNNPLDPRLQGGYLQIWGNITGAFSLTKVGQDVVLLGGVNNFGDLNVREGIVQLGSSTALAATSHLSLATDGLFDLNGFDVTVAGLSGDALESRVVNGATTVNRLTIDSLLDETYAGVIYSGVALVKDGPGTLTLAGPNDYVAPTTLAGGTLAVTTLTHGGLVSGIGSSTAAPENLVFDGGTLAFIGAYGETNRRLTIGPGGGGLSSEGAALLYFMSETDVVYQGAGARTFTFGGTSVDGSFFYLRIGDAGGDPVSIAKSGTGIWHLAGPNTYTGGTVVTGGTLRPIVINALPTGGDVTIAPAVSGGTATLDLFGASATVGDLRFAGASDALSTLLTGSAVLTVLGDVTYDAAANPGQATIDGTLQLAGLDPRVFDVGDSSAAAADLFVRANIADQSGGLVKRGAGTLELAATNYYRGATIVEAGVLAVGHSAALGDASATNTLAFDGGTLRSGGSFALGADRSIHMYSGGGTFDVTDGNVLVIDGTVSGPGGLTKTGPGTLAVQAAASHAGGTFVGQGALVLRAGGDLAGSGNVEVAAGASLVGAAAVQGAVSVSGTISPGVNAAGDGAGIGTLNLNSSGTALTLFGGGAWEFQFAQSSFGAGGAGTDWDLLNLSAGSLALSATSGNRINLLVDSMFDASTYGVNDSGSANPFDPSADSYSWLLANASGGIDISASSISDLNDVDELFQIDASGVFGVGLYSPVAGGGFWVSADNNSLFLNYGASGVSAVPEPGSLALVGFAAAALAGYRRRKRKAESVGAQTEQTAGAAG